VGLPKLLKNGAGDGTRTRSTSFQAVSDDRKSFRLSTGCHRRCSLFQPVLAGCYHDVITGLGRQPAEAVSTVYELADLGVTPILVKWHTDQLTSTIGRLLWALQAWYAEMENEESRSSIRAGHARCPGQREANRATTAGV
jgi:hypothetical protein